jgi:hypothetical protein
VVFFNKILFFGRTGLKNEEGRNMRSGKENGIKEMLTGNNVM